MLQYLFIIIVVHLIRQSEGATLGAYSTSDCSGIATEYTFYEDICTAQNGRAVSSVSCGSSYIKGYVWPDSKVPGLSVPKCGTGTPTYVEASTTCTRQGTTSTYTKILDSTCYSPSTTYLAYLYIYSCSKALDNGEVYNTFNADGQCRRWPGSSSYYYKASVLASSSISFQTYTSSTCAFKDATWTSIPTNGVCYAASNLVDSPIYESLSVAKPVSNGSSSAAGLIAGVVIIIVIGSLVGCCAGVLSIFHCMGCINIPCFNQCCDRRKTVVTSSAPPPVVVQNVVNSTPPQGYSSGGGGGGGQKHSFAQPSYPSQYPSSQSQYSSGHSPYPGGAQSVQSPYPSAQSQYAGGAYAQQPQPSYAQQPQPSYAQQPQSTYPQQPTSYGQQPTYPQQQPQYGQQQPQYGQQAQRRSSDPYGGMRL
jgi:hypothetical protein